MSVKWVHCKSEVLRSMSVPGPSPEAAARIFSRLSLVVLTILSRDVLLQVSTSFQEMAPGSIATQQIVSNTPHTHVPLFGIVVELGFVVCLPHQVVSASCQHSGFVIVFYP